MSVERSGYPAFPTYPAAAGTVSPWRPIDTTTQRVRVTLSGTFTVQVEISNAQARTVPEHLFLPLDTDAEIYATTSTADVPVDIRAPVRWVRLRVLSGNVTGGNVEQSSLSAPAASVDDVDDLRVIAEDASSKAADVKSAIGNLTLAALNSRTQADGPQLTDGSRWTWQASGTPNGGTIVAALGGGVWVREYAGQVDARWFGASEDAADNAPPLNAWLAFLASQGNKPVIGTLTGLYRVRSTVKVENFNGMSILANGYIYADADMDYVWEIKNGASLHVFGRLEISANYRMAVKAAVKIWSDNGGGVSNLNLYNVIPSAARLGFEFGDLSRPNALVSEINIFGGHSYGTPGYARAIGTQAYINLIGVNAVSNGNGGDAAWQALTQVTLSSVGANIRVTGGELQHNAVAAGDLIEIQPITDPVHGNSYGSVSVSNTFVESAAVFVRAHNPENVLTPISNRASIIMRDCLGYHSQNNGPVVVTAADYAGDIMIECPGIYYADGMARTQANIQADGAARIHYRPRMFGQGFRDGLDAVTGGRPVFGRRAVLRASDTAGQAIPADTLTTLRFASLDSSGSLPRWTGQYNAGTGTFTVPDGGLVDVQVEGIMRSSNTAAPLEAYVYVNGGAVAISPRTTGNGVVSISVNVGTLAAGDTVQVRVIQVGAAGAANGGSIDRLTITAASH